MAKNKLQVPVTLSLSSDAVERYRQFSESQNASDNIQVRASAIMEGLAGGGMYLTPEQISKIEKIVGTVESGQDIVSAVGKSAGIEDGQNVFKFSIDPTYVEPLAIRAQECGVSSEELMANVVDQAFENNWVYGFFSEGKRRTFTPADESALAEVLGDGFTVRDIVSKLCKEPVAV